MTTGPSFRFRLERIRVLRQRKEELAKRELASSMTRLLCSEDRVRAVDANLERAHADQRVAAGELTVLSAAELAARQAFVERVEGQRSVGVRELKRSEAEVADRGAALGRAARDMKMLDRLKQRHRAAHDLQSARRESNALDEMALDAFRRSAA